MEFLDNILVVYLWVEVFVISLHHMWIAVVSIMVSHDARVRRR